MIRQLEMVLDRGEWRAVGIVSAEEMEELERAHDAGDIRAEARLELLRNGRPSKDPPRLFGPPIEMPASYWHNVAGQGGIFKL